MHPIMEYLWTTITIEFMIKFFVVYFFVVWIGLIVWVARDIAARSLSRMFQCLCVLIMIIFTPLGLILYLLIRPKKTVYDIYSDEIEDNLSILHEIVEERLWEKDDETLYCPECEESIEAEFIICPSCKCSLKDTCHSCHKVIREWWSVCPYCETKQKSKKKKKK